MSVGRTDAARTSPAATTAPAARASRSAIGLDRQGTALGIDQIQPAMTGRGYAHLEKWMRSWLEGQADVNRGCASSRVTVLSIGAIRSVRAASAGGRIVRVHRAGREIG